MSKRILTYKNKPLRWGNESIHKDTPLAAQSTRYMLQKQPKGAEQSAQTVHRTEESRNEGAQGGANRLVYVRKRGHDEVDPRNSRSAGDYVLRTQFRPGMAATGLMKTNESVRELLDDQRERDARERERPTGEMSILRPQTGPSVVEQRERSSAVLQAEVQKGPAIATLVDEIRKAHRLKRQKKPLFRTNAERNEYEAKRELDALIGLLPRPIREHMLGGVAGMAQVPNRAEQDKLIERKLTHKAGREAEKTAKLRKLVALTREYAATELGLETTHEQDAATWPMTAALANVLIAREHERAKREVATRQRGDHVAAPAAKRVQTGETVGASVRDSIVHAHDNVAWPIDVPKKSAEREGLMTAAPKAAAKPKQKAGTMPLVGWPHLEAIADGTSEGLADLSESAREAVVDFGRSVISGPLAHSARVGNGIDIELLLDERDPGGVMRASTKTSKDSAPINGYAPQEGVKGRYEWYIEHLQKVIKRGFLFAKHKKKRGSGGCILQALGQIADAAASPEEVRDAYKAVFRMKPLEYTAEEIKELGLEGHTMHVTPPEWARTIDNARQLEFLPVELQGGFSEPDVKALGNWQRDAGAKQLATAERAAIEAVPAEARLAAARAAEPGQRATRGQMHIYYGDAGAGTNRISERVIQLKVRQRLVHTVRAVLEHHGGWREVHKKHRGQADLFLLAGAP